MAITRVTQNMMVRQSLTAIENNATRLAAKQEQLATGRRLNRASDSPTEAIAAMRVRGEMAALTQHTKNAEDGLGWLGQQDTALSGMLVQVRRARELGLQGSSDGAIGQASRDAMAVEVEQLRDSLIAVANSDFLGRPVFGGITAGADAYDASGAWIGTAGVVNRTIGTGVEVQINVNGPDVFGPDGASLFDELATLALDLRAGNTPGLQTGLDALAARLDTLTTTLSDVGIRTKRLEGVVTEASNQQLSMTSRLSDLEDADLIKTAIDVKLAEVAHQSALATSARVLSTSLLDFLR